MEETTEQKKIYTFMQGCIYATLLLEIFMYVRFPFSGKASFFINLFSVFGIYKKIYLSKIFTFIILGLTCIGTRAKKNVEFKTVKHVIVPVFFGLLLIGLSIYVILIRDSMAYNTWQNIVYMFSSLLGTILLNIGLDNISKYIRSNFMKDRFNNENESFKQSEKRVENEYSVNIPMKYTYQGKVHKGWINVINPFRGTLLLGTPGSGKSFSVINSYIRQHSAKKFALVVYDYKFPDLAKIAFYHYNLNKKKGLIPNYDFNVINFTDIEHSRRINPLKRAYIETLQDAYETSEALYESLQKGSKEGGNAEFFKTSAVNFLAACIYFLSRFEDGKYSDLPHVLSFINQPYSKIFAALFSMPELISLMSPFQTAYQNKAFDQLEGQIGSLKVQISRLATKESYWVFSGDDFDLKVSDPNNPSYLIIANNPRTQSMNSALNALIINRLTRLVNSKGNLPTSIIVDESPTLYFYQIATLLSTARSNKVSVILGLQEIPQLEQQYGKVDSKTITSVIGNILSGSARNKETLEWLQTIFGKIKQTKESISIRRNETTISVNEQLDYVIPAAKISSLPAGSLVGQIALDFGQGENFPTTMYHCATDLDLNAIKEEEKKYVDLPKFYNFGSTEEREKILTAKFNLINKQVEKILLNYT